MKKVPISHSNDTKIHKFDTIDNRYEFYYNEVEDKYYVNIIGQLRKIELKVIRDNKRDRYCPSSNQCRLLVVERFVV